MLVSGLGCNARAILSPRSFGDQAEGGVPNNNIDEVSDKRLQALKEIEKDKLRVARAYNKKVRAKSFQVGELVWKTILPLGTKSNKFGK